MVSINFYLFMFTLTDNLTMRCWYSVKKAGVYA